MQEIKEKNNDEKHILRGHYDMDGCCSSYLTSFGVPNSQIEIWSGEFGDTTGLKKGDWLCDMRPLEDKIEGLNVLDHHGPYPLAHKYNLIYDIVPATLIAWNKFREEIPKDEWWKCAGGIVGDGQPELIPYEVFKSCPALLNKIKTSAYQSYGKWKFGSYYVYKLLSSPVNSLLRKGDYDNALRLVIESKTPYDIINDEIAQQAKSDVRAEFEKAVKNCEQVEFNNLCVIIFYSKYRLGGYIASALGDSFDGKTIIAINRGRDGHGSIRGELALYWKERLKPLEYFQADGHPGFLGCRCKKNPSVFLDDLTEMLQS